MSRNSRFVSAAKGLLAVQVAGCVGAAGVTGWAAFEVRDMVRERDALAARVAQLEAVIPPQLLPPPPTAIETEAPPPPPDEAQPPDENETVVNQGGGTPNPPPPPSPETVACALRDASRTATECPVPLLLADGGYCFDVERRLAYCPGRDYPPPPPPRDCQSVDGQAIVCAPPFRETQVRGVCIDGNDRQMRCPGETNEGEGPNETRRQQPTRR